MSQAILGFWCVFCWFRLKLSLFLCKKRKMSQAIFGFWCVPSFQIGGLSVLCSLSVLVLYTKVGLLSRLEVFLFCVVFLYWFYIQKKAFPPDWRPLRVVSLVCVGSFVQERAFPSRLEASSCCVACLCWFYVQTRASPSRLEASLCCVACLYWFYMQERAFPPDWRPFCFA